jgi:hypothetical protein
MEQSIRVRGLQLTVLPWNEKLTSSDWSTVIAYSASLKVSMEDMLRYTMRRNGIVFCYIRGEENIVSVPCRSPRCRKGLTMG